MPITEIFKTSFSTVKSHKKSFIVICLINMVIQVVLYHIPDLHFWIDRTLYTFLTTFVYLPFFFMLKDNKVSKKEVLIRILLLAFITVISNGLYTIINKLFIFILKLSGEYLGFHNLFKLLILPFYIIIWLVIEIFGMYVVIDANTPSETIKLICERLKSNFIKTIFEVLIICLLVFLPVLAMSVREILVYQEIQNSLFMKIIIIPPLNLFYLICIFNYCTKKL